MSPQERLIARVRELCSADERLVAALTYGSFAQGTADAWSDIEFWLFFDEPAAAVLDPPAAAGVDPPAWLGQIGPIRHVVVNEFGSHVVFFPGLIRGEFHFATAAGIASVASWPARSAPVDRMIVTDRTGALRRAIEALPAEPVLPFTAAEIGELCGRFANWLVLASHVAWRGELMRAVDALTHAQRHLLWMARLAEDRTQHWLTPSRSAETDLPPDIVRALHEATATADAASLTRALGVTWSSGRQYWRHLAGRHGFPVPDALFAELDDACR